MENYTKSKLLKKEFLKLDSWYKILRVIDDFFDTALYDNDEDIRDQEILKNYYAAERVFTFFYQDYGNILETIHELLQEQKK